MPTITRELIDGHTDAMRAGGLSERTIHDRRRCLRGFIGQDPCTADLVAFLAKPGWAQETRASYHGHLSGYLKWTVEAGHAQTNPLAKVKRPKVMRGLPRPVSDDELRRVLALANPTWRLIITLAAFAGLRRTEIATLRREDVTAVEMRVTGKGNRVRIVPTHECVWTLVQPLPPGLVVTSYTGRPFLGDTMSVTFNDMTKRWGMPNVTLHQFRHWYATSIYRNTRDLLVLQQLLGHSTPVITAVYALVDSTARQAAVASLRAA